MIKKFFILIIILNASNLVFSQNNLDSLLLILDETLEEHSIYSERKEKQINRLKTEANNLISSDKDIYNINLQLYKEYKSYICDSAIFYLNKNIEIAANQKDDFYLLQNKLLLSRLLGSAGMYKEAADLIASIDRKKLPDEFLIDYYSVYDLVYGELAYYTQDKTASLYYTKVSDSYKDSLNNILPVNDRRILIMQETFYRDSKNYLEARKLNNSRLEKNKPDTPEYALATFHRALLAREEGNIEEEKYYLALSALSDIRSATKDHASLWMLAKLLYEEDDIERAYNYIRFSWNETVFYNARLRSLQSADIMSLIDKTYQAMIEKQNKKLQTYLIIISALFLLLIVALVYIYRQMKKLSIARNNLQEVNLELNRLNEELKQINSLLQSTNIELSESNQIKEEYIGRFIKLCSTYIDKLDAYRRMVNKKIANGQASDLLKITRSPEIMEEEFKELYLNFDSAFLQLFPDFVKQFNNLLNEQEPILLKKGELLNTELRIFALIRLGIEDSSQIAEFLRYSVNTIYNYRAKVKNKARVNRDDLESLVKSIR